MSSQKTFELTVKQGDKACTYALQNGKWRFQGGLNVKPEGKEGRDEILQRDRDEIEILRATLDKK